MKHKFLITEDEKNKIISLYKTKNILLLELGDGSAGSYEYEFLGSIDLSNPNEETSVEFITDSGLKYFVKLKNGLPNVLKAINKSNTSEFEMKLYIDFGVIENEKKSMDYPITNRGEIFKVMGTISDIVKEVLENNPQLIGISYVAVEKDDDFGEGRDKLFKLFIKNALNKTGKKFKFDEINNIFKYTIVTFI